jgi:Predicted nucleotidyltransferases
MTVSGVDDLLQRLRGVLAGRRGLLAAYLFGSQASGEAFAASDVDVAVLFDAPLALEEQLRLEGELEASVGRHVDLLDLRRANAFLALDVIRGIRFIEPEPVAADEYELYILRRAGDLEPLERERRALLLGTKG